MLQRESVLFRKRGHPQNSEQGQGWEETEVSDTLNAFDNSESRTPTIARVYDWHRCDTRMTELGEICNTASASWGGQEEIICHMLIKMQL